MKNFISKEQQIIKNFFEPISQNKDSLNLSNDAAFIKSFKKSLVISSDMMIQDTHFNKKDIPELLARKLLRVNLSDLAAMGAKPYGYILNVGIPSVNQWMYPHTRHYASQNRQTALFNTSQGGVCFVIPQ